MKPSVEVVSGCIYRRVAGQLTVFDRQTLIRYARDYPRDPLWRQYLALLDADAAPAAEVERETT